MYSKHSAEIKTGHSDSIKRPIVKAIREKCIDCSGGSPGEVRRCPVKQCALWPYRMGTNPFAQARGRSFAEKTPAVCDDFSGSAAIGAAVISERNNSPDL